LGAAWRVGLRSTCTTGVNGRILNLDEYDAILRQGRQD
jgi:hypothetical protein